ncbi:MAG: SprB repeat-containing protein, partial [Bacteroidota bacterium]|nr:SprB repeat-containing protein [Bacteroidota bacterium]
MTDGHNHVYLVDDDAEMRAATAQLGVSPYTYQWSNGETTSTIQNVPFGISSLTVTDSNGDWTLQTTTVGGAQPVEPVEIINHIDTVIGTQGSISLTVSGGTFPYSYLWSNGETSNENTNLVAGSYTCTITDSNNCTDIFNYTVGYFSPSSPLVVTDTITNNLCSGDNNGSVDLTISGGVAPYSINWSNGNTTTSINNLWMGTYEVSIYDANVSLNSSTLPWNFTTTGYSHSISIPANSTFLDGVAISSGDYIGIFHNDNGVFKCAGYVEYLGAALILTAYGDDPATGINEGFSTGEIFNYKIWDNVSGDQSLLMAGYNSSFPGTGLFLNNSSSGINELNGVSGVDFGVQFTSSYVVTSPNVINAFPSFSNYNGYNVSSSMASDGWISLSAFGGTSPYTFNWSTGATAANVNNLSAGPYQVTITDSNTCTRTFSYTLTAPFSQLTITGTTTDETCLGNCDGEITTNVSGGNLNYSYLWSDGSTLDSINNLCPGMYNLTVSDMQGQVIPAFPWEWTNTGQNHSIAVPSSVLNLANIQIGDSLTLLYLDSGIYKCGGSISAWDINGLAMNAWGDDPLTSIKDGFSAGENFTWIVWHSNTGIFEILEATYSSSQYNAGAYSANGLSAVTQFSVFNQTIALSFEILSGSNIQLNEVISPIDLITGSLGAISTAVSGGTAPYTYTWSTGESTSGINNLIAGLYSLTVTDFLNCTAIDTFLIDTLSYSLPPWQFNFAGDSHSIEISATANLEINGIPIGLYDFIGVFYDDNGTLYCGGYIVWQSNTATLLAYADDPSTGTTDGFLAGDEFLWKFWDASTSTEHTAVATYQTGYPDQQYFAVSGSSAVDSVQTIGVSGTVSLTTKAGLPTGMMLLFQQTTDGYTAVNKTPILNGDFFIEGISAGDYLLYAIPKPEQDFGIPAYYGNKTDWQDGDWVSVVNHTSGANIVLDPVAPYNTGTASISGEILQGDDATYNPDVFDDEWFPPTKANGDPARNIAILLYDNIMNAMDFRLTNELGLFEFTQLEYGSYFIKVEKAGLQSDSLLVVLDANNPIASGISFTLNQGQVLSAKENIT